MNRESFLIVSGPFWKESERLATIPDRGLSGKKNHFLFILFFFNSTAICSAYTGSSGKHHKNKLLTPMHLLAPARLSDV